MKRCIVTEQELLMITDTFSRIQKEQRWMLLLIEKLANKMELPLELVHDSGKLHSGGRFVDVREPSSGPLGVEE